MHAPPLIQLCCASISPLPQYGSGFFNRANPSEVCTWCVKVGYFSLHITASPDYLLNPMFTGLYLHISSGLCLPIYIPSLYNLSIFLITLLHHFHDWTYCPNMALLFFPLCLTQSQSILLILPFTFIPCSKSFFTSVSSCSDTSHLWHVYAVLLSPLSPVLFSSESF